jgi:DNA-binding transcriptional LysR family regulator
MDLDLRKVRYFAAVAEELNFRRAAERLHVAQPVLSRQIRALEKELHAQLFVRDSSGTQLTRAGAQLLAEAPLLLAGADAARRRVAQAARATTTFTVGFMPGLTVTGAVLALGAAHPDLTVEVLRTDWTNQIAVLHDGRADIGYIRNPADLTGLQTSALFSEPRVAVVPAAHRLAGKDTVSIHDLAGEHLLQHPDLVPEWRSVATEVQDRQPDTATTQARSVEEKLEHVAAGRGFSVLPKSTATYYQRSDVAWTPISDIPPSEVRLAWVATRRTPLIAEFVELAKAAVEDSDEVAGVW